MCGRATLSTPPDDLRAIFDLDAVPDLPPRFNIAPTQPIAVIRDPRHLELLRWGLTFERKKGSGSPGINARIETVRRAPDYRGSFRERRCAIVVDGFYEWRREGKTKTPFLIYRADGGAHDEAALPRRPPFLLAGIWNHATTRDGEVVDACAVITMPASGVVATLHDRMPLVVPTDALGAWLDPAQKGTDVLARVRAAQPELAAFAVSSLVNSPANDAPELAAPLTDTSEPPLRLFT